MVRIFADSNVIISAYEFGGGPGRIIDKAAACEIEMAVSAPILAEVRRILGDKFRWPRRELDNLVDLIGKYAMSVSPNEAQDVVKGRPR